MNAKLRDEILRAARQAGQIGFTAHASEGDRKWLLEADRQEDQVTSMAVTLGRRFLDGIQHNGTDVAAALVPGTPSRRELFVSEYVNGFVGTWRLEYAKTPARVAHRRASTLDHILDDFMAAEDLDTFQNNFAVNPLTAFESADRAITNAARRDVALALKGIVEKAGVEAAIEYATVAALRGAQWPSRSTSVMSNLVAQAKLAAFAEVAARTTGRG